MFPANIFSMAEQILVG